MPLFQHSPTNPIEKRIAELDKEIAKAYTELTNIEQNYQKQEAELLSAVKALSKATKQPEDKFNMLTYSIHKIFEIDRLGKAVESGDAKSMEAEIYFSTYNQKNQNYFDEYKSVVAMYSDTAKFPNAGKAITALITQEDTRTSLKIQSTEVREKITNLIEELKLNKNLLGKSLEYQKVLQADYNIQIVEKKLNEAVNAIIDKATTLNIGGIDDALRAMVASKTVMRSHPQTSPEYKTAATHYDSAHEQYQSTLHAIAKIYPEEVAPFIALENQRLSCEKQLSAWEDQKKSLETPSISPKRQI